LAKTEAPHLKPEKSGPQLGWGTWDKERKTWRFVPLQISDALRKRFEAPTVDEEEDSEPDDDDDAQALLPPSRETKWTLPTQEDLVPRQRGQDELRPEKNWLPLVTDDGKLRFIYSFGPLRMFELSGDGVVTEVINRKLTEEHIGEFRGSGPPIAYKGGWLATIHQVDHYNPRTYLERFVWFDREFTTIKFGPLFFLAEEPGVEYNLAICHSDEGLVVAYSVMDASAMLAVVEYEVVDGHLRYSEERRRKGTMDAQMNGASEETEKKAGDHQVGEKGAV